MQQHCPQQLSVLMKQLKRLLCCNKQINKKVTATFSIARKSQRKGLKGGS
jgi:hypothetical protein